MKTIAFAAAFAVLSLAPQAFADAPRDTRSVEVQFKDLDLSQARDAERMLARLDRAAKMACGSGTERLTLQERQEFNRCKQETTARAVTRLGAPMVASAYNERTGQSPMVVASR